MSEQHIMIDLETLSNRPADGAILSVAAVKFDLYNGPLIDCTRPLPMFNWRDEQECYCIVDLEDQFARGMKPEKETLRWWLDASRVNEYVRMVTAQAIKMEGALREVQRFVEWNNNVITTYGWSHGSMYDMRFLEEKYVKWEMVNPFSHKYVMDTRTLLKTHRDIMGYDVVWPEPQMKHHPIDDARRQAYVMQCSLRNLKACVKKEG